MTSKVNYLCRLLHAKDSVTALASSQVRSLFGAQERTPILQSAVVRCFSFKSPDHNINKATDNAEKPEFISGYNEIEELHNASEWVQRVFRIENASRITQRLTQADGIQNKYDYQSHLEALIARRTQAMKTLLDHCQKFKRDKKSKVLYIWTIDQRRKVLRKLQGISVERYYKILQELDIPPLRDPRDRSLRYRSRKFKLNVPLKEKREIHEFEADRH